MTNGTSRADRDEGVISAFKHCTRPQCGLQKRLDALCIQRAASSPEQSPCRNASVARNRIALKHFMGEEGYKWICTSAASPTSSYAHLAPACVDDDGHMIPCLVDGPAAGLCPIDKELGMALSDVHQEGCRPSTCLPSLPGSGPKNLLPLTMSDAGGRHQDKTPIQRASSIFVPSQLRFAWTEANHTKRIQHLEHMGYMTCVARLDEGKGNCTGKPASWLNWAWQASEPTKHAIKHERHGLHNNSSDVRKHLSWWLGQAGPVTDYFDASAFVSELQRISNLTGGSARVVIVGDSTSRQQAVSLCCLLAAGAKDYKMTFNVPTDKKVGFRCSASKNRTQMAAIEFTRIYRGDGPFIANDRLQPVLQPGLLRSIAMAPAVLIMSFGAWDYAEGCMDRLQPTLCGGSRKHLMSLYAQKWAMVSAALQEAYPASSPKRSHSLVMVRTNAPRSNECKDASRKDCWGAASATCDRTVPIAEESIDEGNLERRDLSQFKQSTMRLVVVSQNAIMLATIWQRAPWVRVLDAYEIARLRIDAHPGNKGDCLHYCLPGVPDVWNGRLLTTMRLPSTTGIASEALARWNFDNPLVGRPFVEGEPPRLSLNIRANASTALECESNADESSTSRLGECTDLGSVVQKYSIS